MKIFITILIFLSLIQSVAAQDDLGLSIKNYSLAASDSVLPLWHHANQHGKIPGNQSLLNFSDLDVLYRKTVKSELNYTIGANLIAGFAESNYFQVNQAFAGTTFKGWEIKGGLFHDQDNYAGLSTTNGNLARSQNARPYPLVRISTKDYKPVPLLNNHLFFRAEYSEGILNDKRFVENTRLHHKSFYLKVPVSAAWFVEGGVEHFVMWGGTSPVESIGKMPAGIKDYINYVTGSSGNEDFPGMDQLNVAGNQLGTYQFKTTRIFDSFAASIFLSHPFEDLSGMNWRNWPDNLLGLYLDFNDKSSFITDLLYEYTDTRQQSIQDSYYVWNEEAEEWQSIENDNYFTHSLYRSGFTYHQRVMSSPLFFPVQLDETGDPTGFRAIQSTRFYAHHLGMKGNLTQNIIWKGMMTWIHHFGSYKIPYDPSRRQLSGLLELQYINPKLPIELGLSTAADAGNAINKNLGLQLWVGKKW